MTASDYAADELARWEQALGEQREAEEELKDARKKRRQKRVIELIPVVQALSTRADLRIAEAVTLKCLFNAHKLIEAWGSTYPSTLQDRVSE